MKIKETLDQTKFPTRHLKDIGIEKIRKFEECINDEGEFMKIIKEMCDKSLWLSVTTKDLYYWIEVLNKVDTLMGDTIDSLKKLSDGTERVANEEEFDLKYKEGSEKLSTLLIFSTNLLREASSRSLYNSVDRLTDVLKYIDDLNIIYIGLEAVYTLIRKSCMNGKLTKAHSLEDHDELFKLVYMYSFGFNYLSDSRLDLEKSMELSHVNADRELKLQRFKRIKKGQRELPSLSYFKISYTELKSVKLANEKPKTARNIASHYVTKNELGEGLTDALAMKILFAIKLSEESSAYQNLISINKIVLKAKSVFIHLSTAEEGELPNTMKFVKEHPFNEFIPDILHFITVSNPSELHCNAIEILYSYLCASLARSDGVNLYRQSAKQILESLGVVSMNNKPVHKILSDCASLTLKQIDEDEEEMSAFDNSRMYELVSNAKFIPNETAKDPNFTDIFLDIVYTIVINYKTVSRGNISELLKLLDAQPVDGWYVFKLNQVAKATRILYSIMKNNFEEFQAVQRTIERLTSELKIIKLDKPKNEIKLTEWKYIQAPREVVHKSHRQELIRVLFRLLNSSIFKNDPNQGNFNPNFVSNSKKILDSGLFNTCLELFKENKEENSVTHDVVFISAMHLMAMVLNDLPAQIPKA